MHTLCIFTKLQLGEALMCPGLSIFIYSDILVLVSVFIVVVVILVVQSGGYIKGFLLNIYAQTVSRIPCRHFVLCKVASKTKHFHSC